MTTRTVTAMFDDYADAAEAVGRLEAKGIPHADISIVSNDASQRERYSSTTGHVDHPDAGTGAGTGATLGTVLGGGAGLLAGLGMLAIPGLGPVVAAGWLASTLVGAGAGAAVGGTVGALAGAGIDEGHAHSYAEGIRRGGTLVTVRTDESRLSTVTDVLDDEGTVDMAERESSWRNEGWSGRYTDSDDTLTGGVTGGRMTSGASSTGTTGLGAGTGAGLGAGTGLGGGLGANVTSDASRRRRVGVYPSM